MVRAISLLAFASGLEIAASLKAHAMFADGMVLQTTDDDGPGAAITGTAEAGEDVTLLIENGSVLKQTTTADAKGTWMHELKMGSGGPYTISISSSSSKGEVLQASDVMFGDVFICSGQSNMVFNVGSGNDYAHGKGSQTIEDAEEVIKGATDDTVRAWLSPALHEDRDFSLTTPLSNFSSGACDITAMCDDDKDDKPCRNVCSIVGGPLTHQWEKVTPNSVRPLSAVCYVAVRDAMKKRLQSANGKSPRPVGIVAAYVGGTPVGAWVNDMHADDTCKVPASDIAHVPCDRSKNACPASLWNEYIAPIFASGAKFRAALWYQGEANSDEGYHRTRDQYVCQFKLLINSWREALGYQLPFVWVMLHPWGGGGGAGSRAGVDFGSSPVAEIRLAQADVAEAGLGATEMANNMDGCQSDWDGDHPKATCNLHPGYKSVVAGRLADKILVAAYGVANASPRPIIDSVSSAIASDGTSVSVTVSFKADGGGDDMALKPIHDWQAVWEGRGCSFTDGMFVLNATFGNGHASLSNGTVTIDDNKAIASWHFGDTVSAVNGVAYATHTVLPCLIMNKYGEAMSPMTWKFEPSPSPSTLRALV